MACDKVFQGGEGPREQVADRGEQRAMTASLAKRSGRSGYRMGPLGVKTWKNEGGHEELEE